MGRSAEIRYQDPCSVVGQKDCRRSILEGASQGIHLIEKHHAITATLNKARAFTDEACRTLNVFPESPTRRALTDLAEFCVSRAY